MDIFLENIIVGKADTTASWTSDATVYSLGFMMISSDATYSGTNVKKWKIANGVDAWADIDFVSVAETLAQILTNGNSVNGQAITSQNGLGSLMLDNAYINAIFGANFSGWYFDANEGTFYWSNGTKDGQLNINATRTQLHHDDLIQINASSVTKNGFEIATINDILLKVLTGLNVTGGSISATDTILQAFGKVQNQINGVLGGAIYQGIWNATTNTPSLSSGVGTKGHYYVVSVAGSTNIDGTTDWKIGDWIIFNGTNWDKVDNTDAVSSVNGFIGAVNLTTANVSEITNLYFTQARVLATLLTGYVSGSGTITASDTILQAIQKLNGNVALKEDASNKTDTVAGNTTSSTKYLSVKGYYDYLIGMTWLTDSIFGTWLNGLTGKTTPVDADSLPIVDSADSNKSKKLTFTNLKAFLKTYFDTLYAPKYEIRNYKSLSGNLASATTYYLGPLVSAWNVTANARRFQFEEVGTVEKVILNITHSSAPTNEQATLYLRNNTTGTDYTLGNIDFTLCPTNQGYMYKFTGLSIPIGNSTDQWTLKLVLATMVTAPSAFVSDIRIYNRY